MKNHFISPYKSFFKLVFLGMVYGGVLPNTMSLSKELALKLTDIFIDDTKGKAEPLIESLNNKDNILRSPIILSDVDVLTTLQASGFDVTTSSLNGITTHLGALSTFEQSCCVSTTSSLGAISSQIAALSSDCQHSITNVMVAGGGMYVITAPGNYCLTENISFSSRAINCEANDQTSGKGFSITGTNGLVQKCSASSNATDGFFIDTTAGNTEVLNCQASYNLSIGINDNGTASQIYGNSAFNNGTPYAGPIAPVPALNAPYWANVN